ncbi:cupin domain-containing protein [Longispora sp. K20-0274]|uniref:cupin domain-containing protein n=1 Tax=Longispora sp. K20-0274 TaxID=3088255 RepID=UPI00399BE4FB
MKMTVKSFAKPDEVRPFAGHGHADLLKMGDRMVQCGEFEPGWRWSQDVRPIAKTDSCQVSHLGYVLEGKMRIHMDDGSDFDIGPGSVVAIPPGHDAEVLGDQKCVFLDFGEIAEYAKPH